MTTSGSGLPPRTVSSFAAVVVFAPARISRRERAARSGSAPGPFASISICRKDGPAIPSTEEDTRSSLTSTIPTCSTSRSVSIVAIGSRGAPRTVPRTSAASRAGGSSGEPGSSTSWRSRIAPAVGAPGGTPTLRVQPSSEPSDA